MLFSRLWLRLTLNTCLVFRMIWLFPIIYRYVYIETFIWKDMHGWFTWSDFCTWNKKKKTCLHLKNIKKKKTCLHLKNIKKQKLLVKPKYSKCMSKHIYVTFRRIIIWFWKISSKKIYFRYRKIRIANVHVTIVYLEMNG